MLDGCDTWQGPQGTTLERSKSDILMKYTGSKTFLVNLNILDDKYSIVAVPVSEVYISNVLWQPAGTWLV